MTQEKTLYHFLRDPGFTPEDLATMLRVLRTLFPLLPDMWDGECPDVTEQILAHLAEGVPLIVDQDLVRFCMPEPPSITLPRAVVIPDDPRYIAKDGFLPDEHWLCVYDAGTSVNPFRLLRHPWLPDDIRAMAEAAKQSYEAECAEIESYFRVSAEHGVSQSRTSQ